MTDTRSTTEILQEQECWELLRSQEVGRLAVSIANHPDIFPINFVVDHASIVFRTAEGTKLSAAVLGASVAFEVDAECDGVAWSVVIKGWAVEIVERSGMFEAADLPLYPWHAAPKHRFVRIVPESVTGRRFRVVDGAAAHSGETPTRRAPIE
jgi:hypothetical protein